ncbi:thymine dioxygenase [Cordyceps fumosorosea ARSEF 2679]|uniref:Thymine dioxygenase n=1 Tax=Cordyceps fumosorosea (strain ARSEF 2679) TaxID=1081104 RepID=A0A167ZEA0_CORFA|nr:thymine dioxygenase [Cordyceps fumosorosea ARSEF 2679]OAA67406.1 thymine dioxygenase [Cordyceps fumosorosea ARSEF 2679]
MSVEAAVQDEGLVIPVTPRTRPPPPRFSLTPSERADTAVAILRGFQTAGFIYLRSPPSPAPSAVRDIFARSAAFFAQPLADKLALSLTDAAANRGYLRQGRERLIPDGGDGNVPDVLELKESLEIGREPHESFRNHWPAEAALPGFREEAMAFFETCKGLHVQVMRAVAVGMGLEDRHFDGYVDKGDNTLRLLHYPEVKADVFKANAGQVRAGEHSDYGSITLLFQDDRGGLQVRSPSGRFVDATPIPGTIVVNAGDLLARWSNDTIKSTVHRVVEPPHAADVDVYPPRYSIAYFCNPNSDSLIEAMPGTYANESDKKYGPILSGEYLIQRLAPTY